jgi:hypothetical protein
MPVKKTGWMQLTPLIKVLIIGWTSKQQKASFYAHKPYAICKFI